MKQKSTMSTLSNGYESETSKDGDHLVDEEAGGGGSNNSSSHNLADLYRQAQVRKDHILKRLKKGTEGAIVLTGALESIYTPIVAFVRLAEGIIMPNALEVPLPMR